MEKYNYYEAVKEDVKNYISEHHDEVAQMGETREEIAQELNDTLRDDDSVTGNASGSYTFSTWTAEENLCHNLDLLSEALNAFDCDASYIEKGAEACDVTIRCYLLARVISDVLDEMGIGE